LSKIEFREPTNVVKNAAERDAPGSATLAVGEPASDPQAPARGLLKAMVLGAAVWVVLIVVIVVMSR
jgi:hypothetical protein